QQECKDSNLVRRLWRPPALPGARSYSGCPGGVEPAATTFTGSHAKPLHHRHHRGVERKARESNPHLRWENRLSRAARPTVSGYLPVDMLRKSWNQLEQM